MPGTYKCCVCQETGYSICSRMLSKRKPYRILLMAGLVLAEKMDISSARRLIDNDNVKSCKLCWNHSKDSLSALLSCHEHTEGLCNNEEDCSEIGEGRFVGKTAAVLSELDDDSIITSSVILKYISDEKKAIQDNDKKSSRSFQGAVKFVVNSAPEVSNVNDSIPATNHDVCEIDSVCSTRKRERKQNMSQVYHVDEDMGSGTETKTADPLFEEKNDCEKRRKDRRCGTLNCACCRFYQNEMKKMEEELCSLRRNQGSATDRSTDINKVDTSIRKRRCQRINVNF